MAIGRPISLTPNIATKAINSVATANQTDFTVTGGYRINELAVYRNGVRLAQGRDFTANDGTTVTLTNGATLYDVIEFVVFDSFNVADAIVSVASSQTVSGDLNVTGKFYSGSIDPNSLNAGVGTITRISNTSLVATSATVSSAFHVGSALTANAAGDVESIGIITAASFSGDGSSLTNVSGIVTSNIVSVAITTKDINVSAAATITGALTGSTGTFSGAVSGTTGTFSGAVSGTTGTFSGAVNVDATTDSTSSSTGALIVDGGLGVAKNVYIGAGLSVAGTLTYEDVTNVDSVGLITAKSGVNITGGQLQVGVAYSVGAAGVATAAGFVGPLTGAVTGDSAGTHTGAVDLNGGVLTLDADADTTITADTDDQIDIAFGGSDRITLSTGLIDLKNSGSQSALRLYCESSNAHYTALQAAAHSAYSGNATVTLPASTDTLIGRATTDTLTNKTLTSPTINTLSGDTASFSSNLTVGSGITMGSAGVATFSGGSDLHLVNNVNLYLGNEKDAQILHTGTNFNLVNDEGSIFIQNDATANPDGHIYIRAISGENSIHCADDGQVELYYDNDRKFRTVTSGAQVESTTGDTNLIVMAEEDDSGADAIITARVTNDSASSYIMFGDSSDANIGKIRYKHDQDELLFYTNDTEKWRITSGGNLQNNSDSGKLQLGTSEDLEIYHNGSHSFIDDSGTGNLYIRSGTDNAITLNTDADIILYYDNSIKLQTTNDGTKTTGIGTFTSHVSLPDNAALCLGSRVSGTTLGDLRLYHNGSHSYIDEVGVGNLYIRNGTDNAIWCQTDGQVKIYYDNSAKFETTNDGVVITGISTFSRGCAFNSMLKEEVNIVANKLSAGVNIDIDDGMIWYYSTNETATATPNIRYNSSKSLNNVMSTGQAVTVTIIYKPNGAGYYAALTVDGSGVTEEWNGGAAPSAANAGGYDVLTHTLVKTADATFICLSNVQNYA